jgi:hypothetical protein
MGLWKKALNSIGSTRTLKRPEPAFLTLAVLASRAQLIAALVKERWLRRACVDIEVEGVPGVLCVGVFLWPMQRARQVIVDVVSVDGVSLRRPVSFTFAPTAAERPGMREEMTPIVVGANESVSGAVDVVRVGDVEWRKVERAGVAKEVERLRDDGTPVFAEVNTAVFRYRMTCGCGRVRYAQKKSLHQITLCRVCTLEARARSRALKQYRARRRR